MFAITSASSRASQRITAARARRHTNAAARAVTPRKRTSLGETLAVGLGCDGWKPRHL